MTSQLLSLKAESYKKLAQTICDELLERRLVLQGRDVDQSAGAEVLIERNVWQVADRLL